MRLFISSYRSGDYEEKLIILLKGTRKMAIITNAQDYKTAAERTLRIGENFEYWRSIGLEPVEIDLRPYFHTSGAEKLLKDYNFIWMAGGNTFLLRRALQYSGIDQYLIKRVRENSVILGGESAGAIIAGPTLKGSEDDVTHEDDPNYTPEGYKKDVIWEGLGLINYVPVPHYKTPGLVESIDGFVQYLEEHKLDFKTMKENQAILIDGDKEEFLK